MMPVRLSTSPDSEPIDYSRSFVGRPIRFPYIMLCSAGDTGRACGKTWVAKDELDLLKKTAERRDHEATCKGGLIIARAGEHG
jgi:hypothetical protein